MVHDLLPLSTEAPRCSDFARSIELRPPGTGLFLRRVVLVTVPSPWPKPALNHEWLDGAAVAANAAVVPTRVFAQEPLSQDLTVEIIERAGAAASSYRWLLNSPREVYPLLEKAALTSEGQLGSIEVAGAQRLAVDEPVPPTLLVCTQGSHDICCGVTGTEFADQVEAARADVVVRRVSHTGGHRFAPTLLALPEGRMWAFADLGLVDRIMTGSETSDDFENHCRGWWGAKVGAEQVAETAVRAACAGQPFHAPTMTMVNNDEGGEGELFEVAVGDRAWRVSVTVSRTVPTISCEGLGGAPIKPGREFKWELTTTNPEVVQR